MSQTNLEKIEEILDLEDNLSAIIDSSGFDPLNDSWLNKLRELSEKIEYIRTHLPQSVAEIIVAPLIISINTSARVALNAASFKFNPFAGFLTEQEKQNDFMTSGERGIGILLYEFANGVGPETREFSNGAFWNEFFAGDRINEIKANFENRLNHYQLTFNQFVTNGNMIPGNNTFSPGHTSNLDSFNKHVKANWVQFFVGGSRIEFKPTSQAGYIDVKVINPTSRNSFLFHIDKIGNYFRTTLGNYPLTNIEQHFYIRIKVR